MTVPDRAREAAILHVDAIVARLSGRQALEEVCRFLRASFSHYSWVGVYRLSGDELILDAWDGPHATEHTKIPIARGVCGQAARWNQTVIVDDVRTDPNYLACFLETRAEIVVPIHHDGRVVGEVDIDANTVKAFDQSDRWFLEGVAVKLEDAVVRSGAEPPPA